MIPPDPGSGCLGVLVSAVVNFLFPSGSLTSPGESRSAASMLWGFLTGTGSTIVAFLTMGKVWLSDRHKLWAGIIGIAVYAALLAWAIPFFISYGEKALSESSDP